jgi:hypothetical protein
MRGRRTTHDRAGGTRAPVASGQRRWYRGAIVWERGVVLVVRRGARAAARGPFSATLLGVLVAGAGLLAGGCGGGARQDASEPNGTYRMRVVSARFPARQAIARPTTLVLSVRNDGLRTVPNVAVTLDSFSYASTYPELAANKRPVWVIEAGPGAIPKRPAESQAVSPPGGGQTAYVNTWALGPLAPGRVQTFLWRVVPVKAGLHAVNFRVAAGLAGNARATVANDGALLGPRSGASGGPVQGRFLVHIAPLPPATHVDPNTGRVVPGARPLIP